MHEDFGSVITEVLLVELDAEDKIDIVGRVAESLQVAGHLGVCGKVLESGSDRIGNIGIYFRKPSAHISTDAADRGQETVSVHSKVVVERQQALLALVDNVGKRSAESLAYCAQGKMASPSDCQRESLGTSQCSERNVALEVWYGCSEYVDRGSSRQSWTGHPWSRAARSTCWLG